MAKRKRRAGQGGFSMPTGPMGGMAEKLQQLQQQMEETQEALGDETVSVSSGGGVVTIEITGQQKITGLKIKPEAVDPDDVEMLEDLILAAINEAIEKSQELASDRMGNLTGGLDIPGLF